MIRLVRDGLLTQCSALQPDSVLIVDALAPPDHILNSVLGCADGHVYRHLEDSLVNSTATDRAAWWREVLPSTPTSKL